MKVKAAAKKTDRHPNEFRKMVDLLTANGETEWMVHYDGIHANDLGHRVVANRIFEVLAQNCSGLAKKTKKAEQTSPRWRDESTLKADYGY